MKAMDTNVLVRYLVQDDPVQSPIATQWIESLTKENPAFLTLITLVELCWVLGECYAVEKPLLSTILFDLLEVKEFLLERKEVVWKAVSLFDSSQADFADCLIVEIAKDAGCEVTVSFDKKAIKSAGMQAL